MSKNGLEFGEIRPIIHSNHQGYKVVAIGSELLFSKQWKTFPDFLDDYLRHVLTRSWGSEELRKPESERHTVLRWHAKMCEYKKAHPPRPDGLYDLKPNGSMRAYLLLAYDIYTLQHHQHLQRDVVDRMRHPDQFQGARHELFAAATCIRAGYEIEYEDERDISRRHPEFVATHRATKQKIAVEAKSRHRDGVMGRAGDRKAPQHVRASVGRLLRDALGKPVCHPYVIFFELNLPPSDGNLLESHWSQEIKNTVTRIGDTAGNNDPFNLIVFSNQTDDYLETEIVAEGT